LMLAFEIEDLDAPARKLLSDLALKMDEPMSWTKKPYLVNWFHSDKKLRFFVLYLEPVYPNFSILGWIILASAFWFGITWLGVVGGMIASSGFLFTKWAYALGLWMGLKKVRSKSRLRILKVDVVLSRVLGEAKDGSVGSL